MLRLIFRKSMFLIQKKGRGFIGKISKLRMTKYLNFF